MVHPAVKRGVDFYRAAAEIGPSFGPYLGMSTLADSDSLSVLPPRRYADTRTGLLLAIFVAFLAIASNVFDWALSLPLVIGIGVVLLGVLVLRGVRMRFRHTILDLLTERILSVAGAKTPSRKLVRCTEWGGGFLAPPVRLQIRVAPRIDTSTVKWRAEFTSVVRQVFPMMQPALSQGKKPGMILLSLTPSEGSGSTADESAERVTTIAKELLGENADVDITGPEDDPKEIVIRHNHGTNMSFGARRLRVERVLNTRVPGSWQSHWDLVGDVVTFKRKEPLPDLVIPPEEHLPEITTHEQYANWKVVYGKTENDQDVFWHPREQAHMLVVGPTGSGKTVLLHRVVQAAAQAGWRIHVVDGKRIEFIGFRNWPNVELIGAKVEHQVRMIVGAHKLMEERYSLIESGQVRVSDLEPLMLVLDEVATLRKRIDRWWLSVRPKGAPAKAPVQELLADMVRLGRTAKIHLVMGLQRPDVEFLDGEMRDNFGARAALGRMSPQGAMMMWENAGIGTSVPRGKPGRGYSTTLAGPVMETQFHLVPNPDPGSPGYSEEKTEAVRPVRTRWPIKHIEDLDPVDTDLDGNEVKRTYDDFLDARILDGPSPIWATYTTPAEAASPEEDSVPTIGYAPEETDDYGVPDEMDPEFEGDGFHADQLPISAADLCEGDLAEVDDSLELWGIVESVEVSDTGVMVDFRDPETGDPESVGLDVNAVITVRKPNVEET